MTSDTRNLPKWMRPLGLDRLDDETRHRRVRQESWLNSFDQSSDPHVSWLGHASFLLVIGGVRILIDPVFAKWIGSARRHCPIPPQWRSIKPDAILISHAHMDHLHPPTLAAFPEIPIYLPKKTERFLPPHLQPQARPLSLGQKVQLGPVTLQPVPAQHGGWRYPWQIGYQAFGYALSHAGKSLFYAGDSAYGPHFKEIGEQFEIETALLPIGAYSPSWFLKKRHLNPEEALDAFADLRARQVVPFHFGAYRISLEPLHQPLPRFAKAAEERRANWSLPIGF